MSSAAVVTSALRVKVFKVTGYTFRGSNSASFRCVSLLNGDQLLKKQINCISFKSIPPFNPMYTGRLFHCYMLDKSVCHFWGCQVHFVAFILFLMENPVSKQCRP